MRLASAAGVCGLLLIAAGIGLHAWSVRQRAPAFAAPGASAADTKAADERDLRQALEREAAVRPAATRGAAFTKKQAVEGQLRTASFAFNHPSVLYLGRRAHITLALAENERQALQTLIDRFDTANRDKIQSGSTPAALVMIATLRGRAFKVEPSGAQRKTVLLQSGAAEWTWFVEPLETGRDQLLFLELAAEVDGEADAPVTVKTFQARINVDVHMLDYVVSQARRMAPVSQVLTGMGGLISVGGFLSALYRRFRH